MKRVEFKLVGDAKNTLQIMKCVIQNHNSIISLKMHIHSLILALVYKVANGKLYAFYYCK